VVNPSSDNFDLSSSYELNITEISFDDSTNYCRINDALMFEGVYDLAGFVNMEDTRGYLAITFISFRRKSLNDLPTGMLFMVSPTMRSKEFSFIAWIMLLFII